MSENDMPVTTENAIAAIAWGRAPTYPPSHRIIRRIICADGFRISIQASAGHYAEDSHPTEEAPYWSHPERDVVYPWTAVEVGAATGPVLELAELADDPDSPYIWAWVPIEKAADVLAAHGGAVAWEAAR